MIPRLILERVLLKAYEVIERLKNEIAALQEDNKKLKEEMDDRRSRIL